MKSNTKADAMIQTDVLEIKPCGQINSLYKKNIEEGQKVHWKVKIWTIVTKKNILLKFGGKIWDSYIMICNFSDFLTPTLTLGPC